MYFHLIPAVFVALLFFMRQSECNTLSQPDLGLEQSSNTVLADCLPEAALLPLFPCQPVIML